MRGQKEGCGKKTYKNGDFYEGQWLNGLRYGFGTLQLKPRTESLHGDQYAGSFKNGKFHGQGKMVF